MILSVEIVYIYYEFEMWWLKFKICKKIVMKVNVKISLFLFCKYFI